jgi:hypothetical protein
MVGLYGKKMEKISVLRRKTFGGIDFWTLFSATCPKFPALSNYGLVR